MLTDLNRYMVADGRSLRRQPLSAISVPRRLVKRCWLDREVIQQPRVFCQNSGGCGSSYIVQLLIDNGVQRCFHELAPDLNELGVQHFHKPVSGARLQRLIRYTRHDVFFEANNRLFSLSKEIRQAFPNAQFIHLHRHPAEAIRSAMSKPNVERQLRENVRYPEFLAGPTDERPMVRFCHYWSNMNRRIIDDLDELSLREDECLSLKFEDLIAGRLDALEEFMGRPISLRTRQPVNTGAVRKNGKFPPYHQWSELDQCALADICGPVMRRLGYDSSQQEKKAA